MGLSKSDLNGEVTVIPGLKVLLFALWKLILGLSQGDPTSEVTVNRGCLGIGFLKHVRRFETSHMFQNSAPK